MENSNKKPLVLDHAAVLVVDSKTKVMKSLRMNGRKDSYTEYVFK